MQASRCQAADQRVCYVEHLWPNRYQLAQNTIADRPPDIKIRLRYPQPSVPLR